MTKENKDGGTGRDMQRNSSGVEQDNAGFGGLVCMFFQDRKPSMVNVILGIHLMNEVPLSGSTPSYIKVQIIPDM